MNTIIEEIRAWVERQLKNTHDWLNGKGAKKGSPRYYKMRGRESAFDFVLSILSDLEKSEKPTLQEQPVCEKLGNEIDRFRETEEYLLAKKAGETDVVIARHFAQWGAEHLKK